MLSLSRLRVTGALAGLSILALLPSCAVGPDTSGSVSGRVYSSSTTQPIPGAVVECDGIYDIADDFGNYGLSGISEGRRVINATAAGYENFSQSIEVRSGTRYNIAMIVYVGRADMSGTVSHATLGPVEGAVVDLDGSTTTTDSLGFYEFRNIQQITYRLAVTKDGYRGFSDHNVYVDSDPFEYNVSLKKLASANLSPVADTHVREDHPHTNYGNHERLYLFHNSYYHYRFVLAFDTQPPVDTADPVAATLWLYAVQQEADIPGSTILVGRALEWWDEMALTWHDTLEIAGAAVALSSYEPRWYQIDVTGMFTDWMVWGQPNYGMQIDTPFDPDASRFEFASREHAEEDKRPYVEFEYAW